MENTKMNYISFKTCKQHKLGLRLEYFTLSSKSKSYK